MSTIVERANAEADAAEAENPDEEQPEPIEAEDAPVTPEPEPVPEPSSLTVVEGYEKKMKAEATRHENALAKLHPETWDKFAMCPLCIGDGFLEPIQPGAQPDELWEAITVMAGRFDTGELAPAPFAEVCDVCRGRGFVATGSLNGEQSRANCRACAGLGWLDIGPFAAPNLNPPNKKQAPITGTGLAAVPDTPVGPPEQWPDGTMPFIPFVGGQPDNWGRPAGHPRWGLPTTADGRQL